MDWTSSPSTEEWHSSGTAAPTGALEITVTLNARVESAVRSLVARDLMQ
jgi:hypothetical protein